MHQHESLLSILRKRSIGDGNNRHVFQQRIASLRQDHTDLLEEPQILSPHKSAVTTLDMDRVQDRFLLAGGSDAVVTIYDVSPRGVTQHDATTERGCIHKPVAQSIRVRDVDSEEVPSGHSHSIVAAQWYPVDTGAFVSASAEGSIMVWDTNRLTPVVRWRPFETCRCFHMPPLRSTSQSLLLAVGSERSSCVKLVDLRSGASAHSLVGHNGGISVTQWSPACDTVLASGGLDGAIRLWDIRKSGSNACLAVLDRDSQTTVSSSRGFVGSYAHLVNNSGAKKSSASLAPNNYRQAETNSVVSHGGSISGLAFTTDGHFLVSTGRDGRLQQWDLRKSYDWLVPTQFLSEAHQAAVTKGKKVPLVVAQSTGRKTTVLVGYGQRLLEYSLHRGGKPTQVLEGHLHDITSVTTQEGWMRQFSGGKDGMILVWGHRPASVNRKRRAAQGSQQRERKRARDHVPEDRDSW